MIKAFHKKLGNKIKEIREQKHISRDELGFRADVSGSYIGMIERAEKDLKTSKLFKIAKVLVFRSKNFLIFDYTISDYRQLSRHPYNFLH